MFLLQTKGHPLVRKMKNTRGIEAKHVAAGPLPSHDLEVHVRIELQMHPKRKGKWPVTVNCKEP